MGKGVRKYYINDQKIMDMIRKRSMNVFRSGSIFVRKEIIENEIVGEIVHVKEKRIIQKEKSVNGVMG